MNLLSLSTKVVLISCIVVFVAVVMKVSVVPMVMEFSQSDLHSVWSFMLSWLRPPYLYVVINFIIITIAATSKLQAKFEKHQPTSPQDTAVLIHTHTELVNPVAVYQDEDAVFVEKVYHDDEDVFVRNLAMVLEPELPEDIVSIEKLSKASEDGLYGEDETINLAKHVPFEEVVDSVANANGLVGMKGLEDDYVMSNSSTEKYSNGLSLSSDKPLVSSRFGHRKSMKAIHEDGKKALGVSKSHRQNTLESTWKTITEGRSIPLTRHLRKSDTWQTQHQQPTEQKVMTKSETFNVDGEKVNMVTSLSRSGGSGRLRKEPSLGQDELNRRVEAFINKFNEDMRLQRQESLNQYMEMMKRGAH